MRKKDKINYFNRILIIVSVLIMGIPSEISAQFIPYGIIEGKNIKKHGKVITYEPKKSVVMDYQGDTLTFDLNEYKFKFTTRKPPKAYRFPDGEGYHRIALGVLPGKPGDGGYINYTYHYQRNRLIGYGGGIAFENYGNNQGYDFITPNVVFYSYLRDKNSSPFVRLTAGYGFALKNSSKFQVLAEGGVNLGAALGLRLSTNKVMVDFAIGTKYQQAYYEFDFNDHSSFIDAKFQRLDFCIGFMW